MKKNFKKVLFYIGGHVRISSPPVAYECHLGMNTRSKENLIAANMSVEDIREEIGADSLHYLSLEGLLKSAGGDKFCTGCLNGVYPVEKL